MAKDGGWLTSETFKYHDMEPSRAEPSSAADNGHDHVGPRREG